MRPKLGSRLRAILDSSGALDRLSARRALRPLSWVGALDLLAQAHGTDKSSLYHGYTRWYSHHLRDLRRKRITLLEIGIGGGQDPTRGGRSLRMWRDYLRKAKIFGIDLHEKRLAGLEPHVEMLRADQSSQRDLLAVLEHTGTPDVVIDDGSHIGEHVWCSFETLFPAVRPGGWYVVEDLHTSFLEGFGSTERWPIGVALEAVLAVQDLSPALTRLQRTSGSIFTGISEVHIYPGIVFIRKTR